MWCGENQENMFSSNVVWGKPRKFGLVEPTKQDAIRLQLDGIIC